jgi:hypothetical protein
VVARHGRRGGPHEVVVQHLPERLCREPTSSRARSKQAIARRSISSCRRLPLRVRTTDVSFPYVDAVIAMTLRALREVRVITSHSPCSTRQRRVAKALAITTRHGIVEQRSSRSAASTSGPRSGDRKPPNPARQWRRSPPAPASASRRSTAGGHAVGVAGRPQPLQGQLVLAGLVGGQPASNAMPSGPLMTGRRC